ncbi:hypothetical protein AAZX31_14G061100 [Glycine max]|uniref:Uncharacterized protein n=1 Tax=Glycine max TaxID=3847 RepID=A0A0R0GAM2_SOYBN|nr:hypothetical protein JHK87_038925 [Glycine soja]KAG4962262.1 hypothetical protein JHK86_039130 [Glycine max]KAG4964736.1 hypothetical protein JHK85_039711 [Glycine max]KAG5109728.1 hypothetical protein JHK82_038951 [Glycine max]KAG5121019.1 hypothetical protein JHK84_039359 [Glycine max]
MILLLSFSTKACRERREGLHTLIYIYVKHQRIKKVKFGYYIPLQLEEASKGIALIPNFRFINLSFSSLVNIWDHFSSLLNIWDHAIPLDSSFGGFYCIQWLILVDCL